MSEQGGGGDRCGPYTVRQLNEAGFLSKAGLIRSCVTTFSSIRD
jgi:hypothetical protein